MKYELRVKVISHLSAGRRPKKVTKVMNEMPRMTSAMLAMRPILMVILFSDHGKSRDVCAWSGEVRSQ